MDIEGAEQSALRGAMKTLKSAKSIDVAICTYHKPDDPKVISELLDSLGYSYEFTQGMLFWGKRLSKALIRGKNYTNDIIFSKNSSFTLHNKVKSKERFFESMEK